MKSKSNVTVIFQTFLFLFCFVCSWINLIDNIQEYFEYRYIVTTRLILNEKVNLPSVSICTSNFFDSKKVALLYPQMMQEFENQDLNERPVKPKLMSRLNFSQLIQISYSYEQIVDSCQVYDLNMNRVNCESLAKPRTWYSFDTVCFQWFGLHSNELHRQMIYRREDLVELNWILINLNKQAFQKRHVGLLVNRPAAPLQPFYTNPAFVKSSVVNTQTLVVTFLKVTTERLAAPYKSNCIHYNQFDASLFVSQKNCSLSCLFDRLKLNGQLADFLLIENHNHFGRLDHLKFTNNYSTLLDGCQSSCLNSDCLEEDYELLVKYEKLTTKPQPTFQVKIVYNYGPEKRIVYQPLSTRVQFTSIVAFILSPLAFWIGISFYHANSWCVQRMACICKSTHFTLALIQKLLFKISFAFRQFICKS